MSERYVIIPEWILGRTNGNEALVCGAVIGLSSKTGHCFASATYLAEFLGMSERTVRSAVKRLSSMDDPILCLTPRPGRAPFLSVIYPTPEKASGVGSDPGKGFRTPRQDSPGTPEEPSDDLNKYGKKVSSASPSPVGSGGVASGKCDKCPHTGAQLMTAVYRPHPCPVKGCRGTVLPVEALV